MRAVSGDTGVRLHDLVGQLGPEQVAEGLGVDREFLYAMMAGQTVMDAEVKERFLLFCGSLADAVDWSSGFEAAAAVSGLPEEEGRRPARGSLNRKGTRRPVETGEVRGCRSRVTGRYPGRRLTRPGMGLRRGWSWRLGWRLCRRPGWWRISCGRLLRAR